MASRRTVSAEPDTPLLYLLMNELELKGPKFGCGLAQCGACSVLVDGREVRACVYPVTAARGRAITTLEGLPAWHAAQGGTNDAETGLHPIQAAMIEEQAPQCGYCYSGMAIKAAELLADNPSPAMPRSSPRWTGICAAAAPIRGSWRRSAALPRRWADGRARPPPACLAPRPAQGRRRAGDRLQPGRARRRRSSARRKAPTCKQIDSWIAIHADNTATVLIGLRRAWPGLHHRAAASRRRGTRPGHGPGQDGAPRDRSHPLPGRDLFEHRDRARPAAECRPPRPRRGSNC